MGQVDELKAAAAHAREMLAEWKQKRAEAEAAYELESNAGARYREARDEATRIWKQIRTEAGADLPPLTSFGDLDE